VERCLAHTSSYVFAIISVNFFSTLYPFTLHPKTVSGRTPPLLPYPAPKWRPTSHPDQVN
jgi:hypothetical protein